VNRASPFVGVAVAPSTTTSVVAGPASHVSGGVALLQATAAQSSVLALAGTFLLAAITVGLTAHVAVRFARGSADPTSALLAGPLPAAVLAIGHWLGLEALVWIGVFVVVAPGVLWQVYDLDRRETLIATAAQYTMLVGIGSMLSALVAG
jgi:hypothetical protein